MRWKSKLSMAATALVLVGAGVAGAAPAYANSDTSSYKYPGGTLKAYVYIQDVADADNCGQFRTKASATTTLPYITNNVDWDPIGIGASASIKGAGVTISGNNGGSPSASVTNKNATSAGISGKVCMSWSTIYLGVFSTAVTKVSGTLYTVSAHV